MYMFQLQNLARHKPEVTAPNGEIAGQPISVINPDKVSLMQTELPDKNLDMPFLGSSSSKPAAARAKTRTRTRGLPFRRRMAFRPRLLGSFRLRTTPTMRRFWKRTLSRNQKRKKGKEKHLRRMS